MCAGFDGVIYGNPRQLGVQTLAVVVVAAYAGVGTFIICWIIDKTFGLKISPEKEEEGTAQPTTQRDTVERHDTRVADNVRTHAQDWISPNTRSLPTTTSCSRATNSTTISRRSAPMTVRPRLLRPLRCHCNRHSRLTSLVPFIRGSPA